MDRFKTMNMVGDFGAEKQKATKDNNPSVALYVAQSKLNCFAANCDKTKQTNTREQQGPFTWLWNRRNAG